MSRYKRDEKFQLLSFLLQSMAGFPFPNVGFRRIACMWNAQPQLVARLKALSLC